MLGSPRRTGKIDIIAPYKPLDWQVPVWRDQAPIVLCTGSAGGGKSRVAAEKMHGFLKHYSGATGLMLRKAREYAGKSIVPFMEHTVIGPDPAVRKKKVDTAFEYDNGSVLYWGGMKDETQREGLRSIGKEGGLDIVWIEEAHQFTEQDYNEILGRMRGRAASWAQVILTTNPDTPQHWIYKRLIEGGEAKTYYSGAKDNPNNPAHYLTTLEKMTGVQRDRLLLGRWVQAEGAVYANYDANVHLIDVEELPKIERWLVGIDFGYTNPFVASLWGLDADGRLYLVKQIYKTQTLVSDHAASIRKMISGVRPYAWVADHDAEGRATLERELGVSITSAYKSVVEGIQAVQRRLEVQPDGKPRIFFVREAVEDLDELLLAERKPTSTVEEISAYAWQRTPEGKPNKEEPMKINDHGVDEARYVVAYVDDIDGARAQVTSNPFYD